MANANVQFFQETAGIFDEQEIRERIQANNNDVQAAILDFFEGSVKYEAAKKSTKWDEAAFATSHDGTEQEQASFRIDSIDEAGHAGPSVAPSRPPSRANNTRTPTSNDPPGNVEAWQQQQATFWTNPQDTTDATTGHNFPGSIEEEDAHYKRAIAASMVDAGIPAQEQETGVVNVSVNEVHFGPANRPEKEYDAGQWDLVPANFHDIPGVSSPTVRRNSIYERAISSRIRFNGAPAFVLSAGPSKLPQLAAVLTILHEIPAARNALLRVGYSASKYFHHPRWWRGTPAEYPLGEIPEDKSQEMAEEIHRLMAFLDDTKRSYGCVDQLMQTSLLKIESDTLKAFATAVSESVGSEARSILFTDFVRHYRVAKPNWSADNDDASAIAVVDFSAANYSGDGFPPVTCLYDILNMVMWHQFILPPREDDDALACIRHAGDVIIFRWEGAEIANDIEIPETICIDRYLESHKHIALAIQEDISITADMLASLKKLKDDIYMEKLPSQKLVPRLDHLQAMVERCKIKLGSIDEDAAWRAADARWKASRRRQPSGEELAEEDMDPETHKPCLTEEEERRKKFWASELAAFESALERCQRTIKKYEGMQMFYEGIYSLVTDRLTGSSLDELRLLLDSIKKQLSNAVGNEYALRAVDKFQRLHPRVLDVDSWDDPEPVCKRYLRGVSVADKVVYVCQNASAETSLASNSGGIWWKLECGEDDAEQIKVEAVDETAVRMAAGKIKDKPILVYASDEAIKQKPETISEALSFFVRSDNRVFSSEVANQVPSNVGVHAHRTTYSTASAPSKRKYSSTSMDSAATNRASFGDNVHLEASSDNPFVSPEDQDTECEVTVSAYNTPLSVVSSVVDKDPPPNEPGLGTRWRKMSPPGMLAGESSHVEYAGAPQYQSSAPEMQSRDSMPLIGMGVGAENTNGNRLSRYTTGDIDMVNMDVHEHDG